MNYTSQILLGLGNDAATVFDFVWFHRHGDENKKQHSCSVPYCDELAGEAVCTGSQPHYFCDNCFSQYVTAECYIGGSIGQERTSTVRVQNDSGDEAAPPPVVVSARGELPCCHFLTNECDCAAIPDSTIQSVLSKSNAGREALANYNTAKQRLAAVQDGDEENQNAEISNQRNIPAEELHEVVLDTLSRGRYVPCPNCGQHGEKDGGCMHMTCPTCSTSYCYCCGRASGNEGPGQCPRGQGGCDSVSAYLENHMGWNNFSINSGESAGIGAVHEFHRRRTAYMLRQVKTRTTPEAWGELRLSHPHILNNFPTPGRQIEWAEIDQATAPVFGSTRGAHVTRRIPNHYEEGRDIVDRPIGVPCTSFLFWGGLFFSYAVGVIAAMLYDPSQDDDDRKIWGDIIGWLFNGIFFGVVFLVLNTFFGLLLCTVFLSE